MKIFKLENLIGSEIALEDHTSEEMQGTELVINVKGTKILLNQDDVKTLSDALIKWLPEEKELSPYIVHYDGLWTGGNAVVLAESDEDAKDLVREHSSTVNFKDVDVFKCGSNTRVLFNDNGDM